jgi:hypothetical protein
MFGNCTNLSNQSLYNICNILPNYNKISDTQKYPSLEYIGLKINQLNIIKNNSTANSLITNKGWSTNAKPYQYSYTTSNTSTTYTTVNITDDYTSNASALRNNFANISNQIVKINIQYLGHNITNASYLLANSQSYKSNFTNLQEVTKYVINSNITNASFAFYECQNLKSIDRYPYQQYITNLRRHIL